VTLQEFGNAAIQLGLINPVDLQGFPRLRVSADDLDLILPKADCIGDKFYDGGVRFAALGGG
jgi:hypothetical protein